MNDKQYSKMLDLSSQGLRVSQIISVKESINEVFDLHVPEGNTFIGNKVVNHNTCNFSNLYGGSPTSLASAAGITLEEAKSIHKGWWESLTGIKRWRLAQEKFAEKNGYVKTAWGRKIMLPEAQLETVRYSPSNTPEERKKSAQKAGAFRQAINYPIQGTAADIIKVSMVSIHAWIKQNNLQDYVRMLLTVHDEIVFEIHDSKLLEIIPRLVEIMCRPIGVWPVPLVTDVEISKDWGNVIDLSKWVRVLNLSDPFERASTKDTQAEPEAPSPLLLKANSFSPGSVMRIVDHRDEMSDSAKVSIPLYVEHFSATDQQYMLDKLREVIDSNPGSCNAIIQFAGSHEIRLPKKVNKRGFILAMEALIRTEFSKLSPTP